MTDRPPDDVTIREARDDELGTVAGLRWQRARENSNPAIMAHSRHLNARV
jgi:hypothetical protein